MTLNTPSTNSMFKMAGLILSVDTVSASVTAGVVPKSHAQQRGDGSDNPPRTQLNRMPALPLFCPPELGFAIA